jgi:uncharacterized membrane protein
LQAVYCVLRAARGVYFANPAYDHGYVAVKQFTQNYPPAANRIVFFNDGTRNYGRGFLFHSYYETNHIISIHFFARLGKYFAFKKLGIANYKMVWYTVIMKVFEIISEYFDLVVNYLILLVELVGIVILIYAIVSAVIGLIRRQEHVRLKLAEGIALALEFKMGGELLRTVIVREWNELLILGAIILLRAALTFLIQWEIKIERKNGNMTDVELRDIKKPLTNDIKPKKKGKKNKEEKEEIIDKAE